MSARRRVLGDTWNHRVSAITMTSGGVMLVGVALVGVGLLALVVVVLLWAVAPLLGGGFMGWFYDQRPVRTVAGWILIPTLIATAAALPLLLRARAGRNAETAPTNEPCGPGADPAER